MNASDEQSRARMLDARDRLVAQILSHPNVVAVSIGEDPYGEIEGAVLRVELLHEREPGLEIPGEVDGIPVRVVLVPGGYRLEG